VEKVLQKSGTEQRHISKQHSMRTQSVKQTSQWQHQKTTKQCSLCDHATFHTDRIIKFQLSPKMRHMEAICYELIGI